MNQSTPRQPPTRVRRAYELARLRAALLRSLPALFLFAVLAVEGASSGRLVAAVGVYATAVLAQFLGQSAALAVAPSLLFGLVPFTIVRIAESSGHVCLGGQCISWCLPACLIGGLVGGALVALRGRSAPDRTAYLLTAVGLVGLSGVLGCSCAGGAGMAGIGLGVLVGTTVPMLASAR